MILKKSTESHTGGLTKWQNHYTIPAYIRWTTAFGVIAIRLLQMANGKMSKRQRIQTGSTSKHQRQPNCGSWKCIFKIGCIQQIKYLVKISCHPVITGKFFHVISSLILRNGHDIITMPAPLWVGGKLFACKLWSAVRQGAFLMKWKIFCWRFVWCTPCTHRAWWDQGKSSQGGKGWDQGVCSIQGLEPQWVHYNSYTWSDEPCGHLKPNSTCRSFFIEIGDRCGYWLIPHDVGWSKKWRKYEIGVWLYTEIKVKRFQIWTRKSRKICNKLAFLAFSILLVFANELLLFLDRYPRIVRLPSSPPNRYWTNTYFFSGGFAVKCSLWSTTEKRRLGSDPETALFLYFCSVLKLYNRVIGEYVYQWNATVFSFLWYNANIP